MKVQWKFTGKSGQNVLNATNEDNQCPAGKELNRLVFSIMLSFTVALSGCSVLPASGPSTIATYGAEDKAVAAAPIKIVDATDAVAGRLAGLAQPRNFSDTLVGASGYDAIVGAGDALDITIWEAPPALLFSPAILGIPSGASVLTANAASVRPNEMPGQIVDRDGYIDVPFAGRVMAAGRTPRQIAGDIVSRLAGKAHDPQAIVRLSNNAAANVTIVGDVNHSLRMPLTPKGERLLDALASAGGVKQPVDKMTIQVTRGDKLEAMPLEAVIKDPRQNVRLQADDIVTLLFQPYSFTVLGAARTNHEIPFEGTGLTLSQALGRMGGLDDQRANPKGVFIFRFEDPALFAEAGQPLPPTTKDGKVPVIYRVNMRDPRTLFVAQSFPIKDKDVVYVSNAPLADFSKFLQAVSQIVYPIATIQNTNIF